MSRLSRLSRLSRVLVLHLAAVPTVTLAQAATDTARVAPVIVTATRIPLRADAVPASATVVTGAELRAQGITHLTDALRLVPGVIVAQSGSYGAPTSLFVRGGQSNYTKVLIDGVPANEPGGAFDFGTLTLDDVERIEIVRGPSSVAWGSDALSAVVHVITKRGGTDRAGITARGGTFGTRDVTAVAEREAGAWRGAASGARHTSDGSYALNSAYRNALVSGSAGWTGAASSVRMSGRYASTRAHFPTDFTGAPVDPNSYRVEERASAAAEAGRAIGLATARLIATHSLVSASSVNPADAQPGTSDSYDTRTRRQQIEVRADVPLTPALTASVGGVAEWQWRASASNVVTTSSDAPATTTRTAGSADRANQGAFVELVASKRATTATAGGRLDRSAMYGDFATYRIGVSQGAWTGARLRASVGTAFREPSFDEALPGAFSTGNPDIRPERTASWEVGVEQEIADDRVMLGVTYFSQRFADMIDYFAGEFPGRFENVAAARARGTELEALLRPARGWTIDGSLTMLHTRVETAGFGGAFLDGRPLLRRPERTATAGVSYANRGASVGARVAFVGERQDMRFSYGPPYAAEETLPGYAKLDLATEVPVLARRAASLAATIRVDNALGAEFEPAAGYQAPGRAVLAGLRAAF